MKIAVAGTGYVGLVTGVCLAEHGHLVTCVDVDEKKVELMKKGVSPIYEEGLPELMAKNMERLTFTTDYEMCIRDRQKPVHYFHHILCYSTFCHFSSTM